MIKLVLDSKKFKLCLMGHCFLQAVLVRRTLSMNITIRKQFVRRRAILKNYLPRQVAANLQNLRPAPVLR